MKKRSSSPKGIMLISLAVVLVLALAVPVLAATVKKTIDVYTGVSIYMDDELLDTKDANGNPVEAFIYNGTTYLPVRAIAEAVGKTVQWEGKTYSVYLGKHSSDKPAAWLKDMDYYSRGGDRWEYNSIDKDNLGNTRSDCISARRTWEGYTQINADVWQNYRINGQYTAVSGTLFCSYGSRNDAAETTLKIYGDNALLYTATVRGGENPIDPIDFMVDITGVLELKIELLNTEYGCGGISEVGLWT